MSTIPPMNEGASNLLQGTGGLGASVVVDGATVVVFGEGVGVGGGLTVVDVVVFGEGPGVGARVVEVVGVVEGGVVVSGAVVVVFGATVVVFGLGSGFSLVVGSTVGAAAVVVILSLEAIGVDPS